MDPAWTRCCILEVIDGAAGGDHRLRKDLAPEHPAVRHRLAASDEHVGFAYAEVGLVVVRSPTGGAAGRDCWLEVQGIEQVLERTEEGAVLRGGHPRDHIRLTER